MIRKKIQRIALLPVKGIKRSRDFLLYLFKSLHLSMRRKIAFDYLMIYMTVSIMVLVAVPVSYLFFEISNDVRDNRGTVIQLIQAYSENLYTEEELDIKFTQLTETGGISYQVMIYEADRLMVENQLTDEMQVHKVETGDFRFYAYPTNILSKITMASKQRIIARDVDLFRRQEMVKTIRCLSLEPFIRFMSSGGKFCS